MALVDWEKAFEELEQFLPSKPHHGSKDLALKLAELKAKNTLDEPLVQQSLRAYGLQSQIALLESARDSHRDDRGGSPSPVAGGEPDHRPPDRTEEVHDGDRTTRRAAAAR